MPSAHDIQPADLAPDSVQEFSNSFHAELCNDGFWGVFQVTLWEGCDGEPDREECDLEYGLTEAEALGIVARLSGVALARAA